LVKALCTQCENIEGLRYEIIVADDGSSDEHSRLFNKEILELDNIKYIIRKENVGRAAIRNFLAKEAQYKWLLFIDSDMSIDNDEYILKYLEQDDKFSVVYGGYSLAFGDCSNLRFIYEKSAEKAHTAIKRNTHPYIDLHTANLFISREVMLSVPFDERIRNYGYEDVLLGKELKENNISILHISNPLTLNNYESNRDFLNKTREGLQTLKVFSDELCGYSRLLTISERISSFHIKWLFKLYWKLSQNNLEQQLCGNNPNLHAFAIYKIGYFISLS
jgi:glycosyltransferase involved in cell wall biosynthesis